jgi:hypothetical protein
MDTRAQLTFKLRIARYSSAALFRVLASHFATKVCLDFRFAPCSIRIDRFLRILFASGASQLRADAFIYNL